MSDTEQTVEVYRFTSVRTYEGAFIVEGEDTEEIRRSIAFQLTSMCDVGNGHRNVYVFQDTTTGELLTTDSGLGIEYLPESVQVATGIPQFDCHETDEEVTFG